MQFFKKGLIALPGLLTAGLLVTTNVNAANLTLYTDYNAWLAAVNASTHNLGVSTFETNYTNVSKEEYVSPFQQLPLKSDPDYLTTRTDTTFNGNNVNLGVHATFNSNKTGFPISFEVSATETYSGSLARIYYNDIPYGKTPAQVDSFTDILSIGKFNGFNGSDHDWDNDDFTLEVTSNNAVYAMAFDIANNKKDISESIKIFTNKNDSQPLAIFDQGSIPGYTGGYDSNYNDIHFIGIVSDTPFSWLEFNEDDFPNDIGLLNFRFATPQSQQNVQLLVSTTGTGSGSFTINPAGIDCGTQSTICMEYSSGTNVSVIATPSSGDTFISWSGCDTTSGQTCNLVMTAGKNITAHFENDSDNDNIPDNSDNCPSIANPNQTDTDNDNVGNLCDAFPNDSTETKDSDGDGMGDNFETNYGFNITDSSDASEDLDGDGLTNLEEFQGQSDPSNINDPVAKTSVFLRNTVTGSNKVYSIDGINIIQDKLLNVIPLQWQLAGTGDFNGDGEKDLIWRNSETGDNWVYILNNLEISQSIYLNTVSDTQWKIVGITDFDGNGKDDILWRHSQNGQVFTYRMNGPAIVSINHIADTGSDWHIKSTGDFNGDGKGDILWRNIINGTVWMYIMDGDNILSSHFVAYTGLEWDIKETGDFDGDGKDDILWRNEISGSDWIYFMDGAQISQSSYLNSVPDLNWEIVQTDDFNRDGKKDILWRNSITGTNWIYLMDGTNILDSHPLNDLPDMNWHIVPDKEQ